MSVIYHGCCGYWTGTIEEGKVTIDTAEEKLEKAKSHYSLMLASAEFYLATAYFDYAESMLRSETCVPYQVLRNAHADSVLANP